MYIILYKSSLRLIEPRWLRLRRIVRVLAVQPVDNPIASHAADRLRNPPKDRSGRFLRSILQLLERTELRKKTPIHHSPTVNTPMHLCAGVLNAVDYLVLHWQYVQPVVGDGVRHPVRDILALTI
jgi:hypothetical protein